MAGFSNIGEAGYQIAPPTLGPQLGSTGYVPINIPHPIRNYAGYFQPSQYQMGNSADTSAQHEANVYMGQSGIGQTGQNIPAGLPNYGFSAEDWVNINKFLSNPLSQENTTNYNAIVNRLKNVANTGSQFAGWTPTQRQQWATDFPQRISSGFGTVPAPILQNWGLAYPSSKTSNLRF